jgi:hypothetical protein
VKQGFGVLNAEVASSLKAGKTFLMKARPTGHWDPANPTKSEESWVDLPEGYFQIKDSLSDSTTFTTQVGFNTFTWGVTDGFNPVDVVSARRYSDPIRSEKLGAFSLAGKLDFDGLLFEGIYIPVQRRSILPGDKSRWLPREIGGDVVKGTTTFHPPRQPEYQYAPYYEYDAALKNNFGARISSHFWGMDAAAYYFDGASSLPATGTELNGTTVAVLPRVEVNANSMIGLRPIYHRITMTGGSLTFPFWELLVRSELAITKAYRKNNASITENITEAALELEHTFSGESSSFTAIGLLTFADLQENAGQSTSTPSLARMFDRGITLGGRWQPADAFTSEMFAVFDTKATGVLYHLEGTYKLDDAWKVYGLGEMFQGKTNTPIGVYHKNNRIFAGIKVSI